MSYSKRIIKFIEVSIYIILFTNLIFMERFLGQDNMVYYGLTTIPLVGFINWKFKHISYIQVYTAIVFYFLPVIKYFIEVPSTDNVYINFVKFQFL